MTIAFTQRQLRSGVTAGGAATSQPLAFESSVKPGLAVPPSHSQDAADAATVVPQGKRGAAVTLRRWIRLSLRFGYRMLRPVLRPMAWRTRSFLLREVTPQLEALRLSQASLGNGMQRLTELLETVSPAGPARMRQLRRKVHQFHAGSATGDAITNAMLLIQRHLRAMGYDSEIFVEHIGAGLERQLHPIEALPRHDDHVLLVHHSLGHAGFDLVAASVAPKILIYHNITPPELLTHSAHLQRAAELGRRQLALWRDRVVAALADSVFNGVELHRLGFPCVLEAALLFDTDTLLRAANAHAGRRVAAPFTVLFVGRMVPSKGQYDLVRAFAVFTQAWSADQGRAARLVLAGGQSDRSNPYRDEVKALVRSCGLQAQVLMTGKLSDAELRDWYGAADLYVSLSRHEGFGVPLVEAMAHGVPVIAMRAGAVAETLGPDAALVDDADPERLAARMLEVARDPQRAGAMAHRQIEALRRWELSRHLPVLRQALALAGAAPAPVAETQDAVISGMRVRLIASGEDAGAWALASQALWRGLELIRPGQARPPSPATDGHPSDKNGRERDGAQVVIVVDPDCPVATQRADCRLALLGVVEHAVSQAAVQRLNIGFDGVLACDTPTARALVDAGVRVPIRPVGRVGRGPESLSVQAWATRVSAAAADILMAPPLPPLRLAWVSPWNVRCGIAEYSRQLLTGFPPADAAALRVVLLCDRRPHDAAMDGGSPVHVQKCFNCGDSAAAGDLGRAIASEDPDVLMIQHQPGILPWVALAELLAHPALARRCVGVTLHNTGDLALLAPDLRRRLAAGLGGISRVIVHARADLAVLGDLGVGNVAWVPHGCDPVAVGAVGGRAAHLAAPLLGTTGFILPHKGFRHLLRAAALLRQEWPGLRVRMVTARHTDPSSDAEFDACQALIAELDLAGCVDWHTAFEPGDRVLQLLAPCDVLVMPYGPSHESASGAVRRALASGVATLVSDLALFDDLGDAVARLPDTSAEAIAEAVTDLLRAPAQRQALRYQARQWLAAHDWQTIGTRLQGMLVGLHREHQAYQMELVRAELDGG